MESITEGTPALAAMSRYEDGFIKLRESILGIVEDVANGVMAVEAERMREAIGSGRNGVQGPRVRDVRGGPAYARPSSGAAGSFPEDVIERCQRAGRVRVSSRGFEQREHRKLGSLGIGRSHAF